MEKIHVLGTGNAMVTQCFNTCYLLEMEKGNLLVYGTIIGTLGNRHSSFMEQLHRQCDDIRRLSELGDGICVCGDFNCSFSDNYCFTQAARTTLLDLFRDTGLTLLTERQTECIDHIAVSSSMVTTKRPVLEEWNVDKRLSDHKGIVVTF